MLRCWIYHAEEDPMIVDKDDAQSYYDKGWKDSPRYFIKTTDFDVDPDDVIKVQQLGESIEGVKDALNGALNLKEMRDKDLKEYALTNFGKEIKGRGENLVSQIEAMINGNGSQLH